jgi:hypothetical protein
MSRGDRGWRHRASAVSSFKSVFAGSNGSRSERYYSCSGSSHCQDESCRHGPADFECCGHGSSGFLREQPWGNIGCPCSGTPGCWIDFNCVSRSRTICANRTVESTSWKFGRRCNRRPREEHFCFSRLRWMPRRERSWRHWASADSNVQSVSASSIDSRSESTHCPNESCRHGPAGNQCC